MEEIERTTEESFMLEAIKEAQRALDVEEIPVGCVIVKDNVVIGRGHNNTNITRNGTQHAEIVAITKLFENERITTLAECDLYVTCEPCIMCAAALGRMNIRKVYFGCFNDRFGGNGSILDAHLDKGLKDMMPYEIVPNLLKDEAIQLFQTFYSTENRRAPLEKRKRKFNSVSAQGETSTTNN